MALKKGQSLVCVPCGRQVIVSSAGIARTTLWCCGKPMAKKTAARTTSAKKQKPGKSSRKKSS